jgi:hypothetical protein
MIFDRDLRTQSNEGGGEILPAHDWQGVSPLPSPPPRKFPLNAGRGSPPTERKTVALNPSAPRIEGAAKRRRPQRRAGNATEARERFARTFADVLSERFGGRWAVEWEARRAQRQNLPHEVYSRPMIASSKILGS